VNGVSRLQLSYANASFWALYDDPSDCPAVQLQELLREAKRRGELFELALADALPQLRYRGRRQRQEWEDVWADTRVMDAWWCAYNDVPDPAAKLLLIMDPESVEGEATDRDKGWPRGISTAQAAA
jgi:hypothetical protein